MSCDYIGSTTAVKKGSLVTGCILDVDLVECCLVLSLNPQLTSTPSTSNKQGRRAAAKVKVGDLQPGSTLLATVEHKTAYYFVLSCNTMAGSRLAYGIMDTVSHCYSTWT